MVRRTNDSAPSEDKLKTRGYMFLWGYFFRLLLSELMDMLLAVSTDRNQVTLGNNWWSSQILGQTQWKPKQVKYWGAGREKDGELV